MLQDILAAGSHDTDLSGNPILKDVGPWMRGELKAHFKDADIKYIDPSYMIRSTPTISADRIYCKVCLCLINISSMQPRTYQSHESHNNLRLLTSLSIAGSMGAGMATAAAGAGAGAQCGARCICWLHRVHSGPCQHPLCLPAHSRRHPGTPKGVPLAWPAPLVRICSVFMLAYWPDGLSTASCHEHA